MTSTWSTDGARIDPRQFLAERNGAVGLAVAQRRIEEEVEIEPHLTEFAQGHGADAAFAEVHLDEVLPGGLHALHFEWFDLQDAPK